MARRAPAVERSIAVLNFLAARPEDRYTLSEIARSTNLNKATLHAIINGCPSISVPAGFTKGGLPVGLMLSGRPFDEPGLLRLAHA